MIDNWESEFRKQVALDGHTIEMLDRENKQLRSRIAELEQQAESMRNEQCPHDYQLLKQENERLRKHWQPRGNDEGGVL